MPDSIHTQQPADSVHEYYAPRYTQGFPPTAADTAVTTQATQSLESLQAMELPQGAQPVPSPTTPLHDSGTMALAMAALFVVVVSYRTGYKYIQQFAHNLFSVRRRENVFEDRTINETWILTALTGLTCVMEGILAFFALDHLVPSLSATLHAHVTMHTAMLSGVALIFYLLQLLAYTVVGHTFTDSIATKLWADGFKAEHSLLGILLTPVVGAILLVPSHAPSIMILAAILYILCRILFICKGFRIFYHGIQSLVYFILYLCSVEIVPLVLLSAGTVYLCSLITV